LTTHDAAVAAARVARTVDAARVARTVAVTIAYNRHPTLPSPRWDPPSPTVPSTCCCLSCHSLEAPCPSIDIHGRRQRGRVSEVRTRPPPPIPMKQREAVSGMSI